MRRIDRRKLMKNKVQLIRIAGIPIVAAVIAVICVLCFVEREVSYKIEQKMSMYYAGTESTVEPGIKMKRLKDGSSALIYKNAVDPVALPMYLTEENGVVMTKDAIYYEARTVNYKRLALYSEMMVDEYGAVTVARNKKETMVQPGFIYDGADFYLFLEPVTVKCNGRILDLSPLSYIEAIYGGDIMVFDYETKEFYIDSSDGVSTAGPASGDYEISLFQDTMTLANGENYLLISRPDLFDPVI